MWKKIKDSDYFLSFKHDNDYEICVTDYVAVWCILYSEKAFVAQVKNSNKIVQFKTDNDYITKGLYLLSNMEQLKNTSFRKEDDGNSLHMSLKIPLSAKNKILLSFECKLVKGSDEIYFEKITRPLLKTIHELHQSQLELKHALEAKDKEINEYKIESETHQVILRASLITRPFNNEEHMKKYKSYKENFGSNEIPMSLLEKSFEMTPKNVKQEPTAVPNIKQEPTVPITKPEPNIPILKPESGNIKQEPISIKEEQHTPTLEEFSPPLVPTVSCKQEAIKREQESSQTRNISSRKRFKKLNY